jgi:hypothetical protein
MIYAITGVIMAFLELVTLWKGRDLGISVEWVESTLIILTPILLWFVPKWAREGYGMARRSH